MRPRAAKLTRGRSRGSKLLVAWEGLHLFAWTRGMAHDRDSTPSHGAVLRWRRDGGWTHLRVTVMQRNRTFPRSLRPLREDHVLRARVPDDGELAAHPARPRSPRGTLTLLEVARWDTAAGTTERIGLKSYVRIKLSSGGREVPRG